MQNFRNLNVWQRSHRLTLNIYKMSRKFPPEERFGLTAQIRRAAYSIPANIAEGCGRGSKTEFRYFLTIAMGSACEVEYFLTLAKDLELLDRVGYCSADQSIVEIKRMLTGLIERVQRPPAKD